MFTHPEDAGLINKLTLNYILRILNNVRSRCRAKPLAGPGPALAWPAWARARPGPVGLGLARPNPKTIENPLFFEAFRAKRLKNNCFLKPPS